ncbi:MAG TPA: hypothetical protein VIS06_07150 [Mycobacteriales bacterium]
MKALGERLRYLATVQKVGPADTGVLAVTVYAELVRLAEPGQATGGAEAEAVLDLTHSDSVTLTFAESSADRAAEIEELLRRTLRQAVERFLDRIG